MTLKLITKTHLIDNIWAFRFEPSEPLTWVAGQFIRVELVHDNPDSEGMRRWFTVSSPPYEAIVQITTRVTNSTFKQALSKVPMGSELPIIEEPSGDFVWQDSDMPIVFVAGGIGVTPFYSILKQRVHDKLPLNVTLVYGSRADNVPFKDEFTQWAQADSKFKTHYAMGEPLTAQKLTDLVSNLNQCLVYLSGPEPMVETLGDDLRAQGLPERQLKQDFFPSYTAQNY